MSKEYILNILRNLCNMFRTDGTVVEEIIEMLLDAGANVAALKEIGFTDEQISDYAYYEGMMSGRTEEEVLTELYSKGSQQ